MKLRFALDLGTNSLGWAVMRYDGECEEGLDVTEIIDSGVRIFSDGRDRNKEPLNQARRLARGMRKNRRRRNLRVAQTADLLQQAALIPPREAKGIEAKDFAKLCPYQARSDAATAPVDTIVLGRALLHLGKRRGYQSNRREEGDDKEAKANLKRISELRAKLDERNQTLGQYLHEKHQDAIQNHASQAGPEGIRFRGKDGDYSNRAMLKHEFAQIRAIQEPHHQLGAVFWNHLHHAIFDQGNLKPQPRGKCQFLPEFDRCYKAVPSYQQFRLLQVLNDLRWVDDNHNKKPLSAEQRQAIYEKLMSQKKVSFSALKKVKHRGRPIFEGITEFSHESEKRKDIEGNETLIEIDKCGAGPAFGQLAPEDQDQAVTMMLEAASEGQLQRGLAGFGLDQSSIEALSRAKLPKAMGNLSAEACRRLIPYMQEGQSYTEAVVSLGEELGRDLHHSNQFDGEILDQLPYYAEILAASCVGADPAAGPDEVEKRFGKIANPTVHVAMNQMRIVLNDLLNHHGRPDQMNIELARDLKKSRDARVEIEKQQRKNQKENDRLAEILEEQGFEVRMRDIKRLKLWEELGPDQTDRRCIFSGRNISLAMVLNGEVEVEHILPFSRTLDDSMANKTLALREANRLKKNNTPYEAFGHNKHVGYDWDDIKDRAEQLPKNKRWRFHKDAMQEFEQRHPGFIASQLTDTAYIARLSRQYAQKLVKPGQVNVISGQLTAQLRGRWKLNSLLSDHNKKNRSDHRHHAIDAVTVGLMTRSLLQAVANQSSKNEGKLELELPELSDELFEQLRINMDRLRNRISHKPDHGTNAEFFNETVYGEISEDARDKDFPDYNLVTRKPLEGMTPKQIAKIRDRELRRALQRDIHSEADPKAAIAAFSEQTGVKSARFLEKNDSIHWVEGAPHRMGYVKSQYCFVDIWYIPPSKTRRERWQGEFVSFIEASQGKNRKPEKPHPAARRIMRLFKGDLIELQRDYGEFQHGDVLKVFGLNASSKRLDADYVNITDKDRKKKFISINVLAPYIARVVISPSGRIRRIKRWWPDSNLL